MSKKVNIQTKTSTVAEAHVAKIFTGKYLPGVNNLGIYQSICFYNLDTGYR